eukprot:jgi/Botrbrau1/4548/Bobra.60_2s0035.1
MILRVQASMYNERFQEVELCAVQTKEEIAHNVKSELTKSRTAFGFQIIQTLVTILIASSSRSSSSPSSSSSFFFLLILILITSSSRSSSFSSSSLFHFFAHIGKPSFLHGGRGDSGKSSFQQS